jgi:hypothetical protein
MQGRWGAVALLYGDTPTVVLSARIVPKMLVHICSADSIQRSEAMFGGGKGFDMQAGLLPSRRFRLESLRPWSPPSPLGS